MSDARLPINHWDTGKVSRDKINDSFNDLVTTVQWYEPTIVGGYWYIWGIPTWVKAQWDNIEMKVDDWYIRYKSSSINSWTQIIAIADLKWDKWDTGNAATLCVGTVCTGAPWSDVCVTNSGDEHAAVLNFTIPQWATWCTGDTWARIYSAKFCGDDMVFTETNGCKVTIVWAKTTLTWPQWEQWPEWCQWPQWCEWPQWCTWPTWARICAAAFSDNDIVFTEDNGCTVTLCDAKTCLKWDTWTAATVSVGTTTTGWAGSCACVTNTGTCCAAVLDFVIPTGAEWPAWNGICCVTTSKSGKTTTVCMEYTSWEPTVFCVQDWADWAGSWDMCSSTYDPCSCMADAFDYCNFYNTPTIPTDNCQLANSCGYTTCTGTVVVSDLTPYAKSCTLCTVATSGMYCDLSWTPTIPAAQIQSDWTQSCNACKDYIKNKPNLCTVATSWKYCDLTWQPTIPTDNCQLWNSCWFTTCTWTLVASDLNGYATTASLCTVATSWKYCDLTGAPALCTVATSGKYCDLTGKPTIPTNNNQLTNGCWYTTCTWTLSTCSDVISALGYTPYNSTNPSWYTTCTGTLCSSDIACINWCCLTNWWNIVIQWWIGTDTTCTTTQITNIWAWTEAQYNCIGTKCSTTLYHIF